MSVKLIESPNDELAATFNLQADVLPTTVGGVIIPRRDDIVGHVPFAQYFYNTSGKNRIPIPVMRIDMMRDTDGKTLITLNLSAKFANINTSFKWDEASKNITIDLINSFSKEGKPFIESDSLLKNYDLIERHTLKANNEYAQEVYDVALDVLTDMAAKHGGGFEILKVVNVPNKPKNHLAIIVATLGACAGCNDFKTTYGNAHKEINRRLSSQNPYKVEGIGQSKEHKGGMVFKRMPMIA